MATIDPVSGPPPEFDIGRTPALDHRHPPRKRREEPRRKRPSTDQDGPETGAPDDPFAIDVYEPNPRRETA